MTLNKATWLIGIAAAGWSLSAGAAVETAVTDIASGTAAFDAYVKSNPASGVSGTEGIAGATDGQPFVGAGVTINRTNPTGSLRFDANLGGNKYADMTGQAFSINPALSGLVLNPKPLDYKGSGLKVTITGGSVNYFGIEIGDWGTCCQPSSLYISFGSSNDFFTIGTSMPDGTFVYPSGSGPKKPGSTVFVSALTDFQFDTVYIWGDGVSQSTGGSERLLAGGTIRYANVGTQPPNPTPAPATLALALLGMAALWASRRRQA